MPPTLKGSQPKQVKAVKQVKQVRRAIQVNDLLSRPCRDLGLNGDLSKPEAAKKPEKELSAKEKDARDQKIVDDYVEKKVQEGVEQSMNKLVDQVFSEVEQKARTTTEKKEEESTEAAEKPAKKHTGQAASNRAEKQATAKTDQSVEMPSGKRAKHWIEDLPATYAACRNDVVESFVQQALLSGVSPHDTHVWLDVCGKGRAFKAKVKKAAREKRYNVATWHQALPRQSEILAALIFNLKMEHYPLLVRTVFGTPYEYLLYPITADDRTKPPITVIGEWRKRTLRPSMDTFMETINGKSTFVVPDGPTIPLESTRTILVNGDAETVDMPNIDVIVKVLRGVILEVRQLQRDVEAQKKTGVEQKAVVSLPATRQAPRRQAAKKPETFFGRERRNGCGSWAGQASTRPHILFLDTYNL